MLVAKGNVAHEPQEAHSAGAEPGFCSMKQLGALLFPPGWDASQPQGYQQHFVAGTHFIHLVERENMEKSFLSNETTRRQRPGLKQPTLGSGV